MENDGIEIRVLNLEDDRRKNEMEHKEFRTTLENLNLTTSLTTERYGNIINMIKDLKEEVSSLKKRPLKFYDYAVFCAIGGAVGWIISKL